MKTITTIFIIALCTLTSMGFSQTNDGNSQLVMSPANTNFTDGSLTFSVLTLSNGATYSPQNCLAIWIRNQSGGFVKSRKVMASVYKVHLVKWVASSGNNSVNAITGPTLPNHQQHTITWDCRDLAGNLVPDGTYQVWIEYTSRNSASGGEPGPSHSVSFVKGTTAVSFTPPDQTYFRNMTLNYTPSGVGFGKTLPSLLRFEAFPNPFRESIQISFELPCRGMLNVSVYDISGIRVAELVDEAQQGGSYAFSWDGRSDNRNRVMPGIYLLRVVFNNKMFQQKILLAP